MDYLVLLERISFFMSVVIREIMRFIMAWKLLRKSVICCARWSGFLEGGLEIGLAWWIRCCLGIGFIRLEVHIVSSVYIRFNIWVF